MTDGHVVAVHLRCEYRDNPVGLAETRPRLSWIPEAFDRKARGVAQTAYQVQVTSNSRGFDEPTHWDSGIVESAHCNQIEYDGRPLKSGEACHWRVRLRDEKGRLSRWSDVATWRMSLLARKDWKASWVGVPDSLEFNGCKWLWQADVDAPQGGCRKGTVVFSKSITLPVGKQIVWAKMLLAADDCFELHVNGHLAGESSEKTDSYRARSVVDVRELLHEGENLLSVAVTNHTDGDPAGVAGKLVVRFADQTQLIAPMDESWSAADKPARAIFGVGVTDPIARPITPWGVPGRDDGLILRQVGCFRREFDLKSVPADAVLHATALGLYEVHINGKRVGEDAFTPGWTDYTKRVYVNSYEVADLLRPGRNVITAYLAEGWYCGYVGWSRRRDHYGDEPMMMMQLNAGDDVIVATDSSWKVTTDGPVREADILMGETYDATKEMAGWTEAGWDDSAMARVVLAQAPSIAVEGYPGNPVRATEELRPIAVSEPRRGAYIFDMGQNFTGVVRVKVTGPRGSVITLRHAEVLTEDGALYIEALRGARCTNRYVKGTDEAEEWQPRFTFHGFRFVEVEGLDRAPELTDVTGVVLHSEMERAGDWQCSSEMVNKLAENIRWGQRGNFLEIPTDCPQRDERLGWTGDAQIFIRTATYQFDVATFFTKWLRDLFDSQRPEGWFCIVAPAVDPWPNLDGGFAAWTDAGIICPWTMYRVYGDKRVVEKYWDQMVRHMDFLERTSKNLIRPNEGFGDWVSLNADTPRDLLGTAYFAYDAMLMADMARGTGRNEEATRFDKLYEDIRGAFQREFIEHDGGLRGRTQCAYVLALRYNLLPDHLKPVAISFLAQDMAYRAGHFSTGFVGLKDLMPTLTDAGRHDLACRILLNEEFPSWGYQIRNGATTTWERWDGWSEELGLQTPHMNSFNHYAFGAVSEWMFSHLAGIDTEGPGFDRVVIRPHPDPRLRYVRARYRATTGWISTEWQLHQRENVLKLRCRIPAGSTAEAILPASNAAAITEGGTSITAHSDVQVVNTAGNAVRVAMSSGHFEFEMPWQ